MIIGGIEILTRPLIVAEIGANHEGDLNLAKAMIREAARCGVDAVKFQTYQAETIIARSEPERFRHFQRMALPDVAYPLLAQEARARGVLFLSTPFSLDAVDLLDPLVPAFKIASSDLTFQPLLEQVAQTGKPILLSTGMATLDEIATALETIQRAAGIPRDALGERVVLLHCVSSYPLSPEEANLRAMDQLRERFSLPVGYSDHTIGMLACLAAVAMGARVIEKHFTLNKSQSAFRDHQLSAEPAELAEFVAKVRTLVSMLGHGRKEPMPSELANRAVFRRSLAARITIKAGEVITEDQLICVRPGTGLAPAEWREVVGKVAVQDIPAGHLIPVEARGWACLPQSHRGGQAQPVQVLK